MKKKLYLVGFLFFLVSYTFVCKAQKYHKLPRGYKLSQKKSIRELTIQGVDDNFFQEAQARAGKNKAKILAYGKAESINFIKKANLLRIKGAKYRQLVINVPQARGIAFSFDLFNLSPQAEFYIYNAEHTASSGPYTYEDVADIRNFATLPLKGSKIILELYEPKNNARKSEIHIEGISVVHKDRQSTDNRPIIGTQLSIPIGINSQVASAYQKEKNAVVALIYRNINLDYKFLETASIFRSVAHIDDGNLYLFSTGSEIASTYTEAVNKIGNCFFIFNYDGTTGNTIVSTPSECIQYPHLYSGAVFNNGNGSSDYSNASFMYIQKSRLPVDASYYELGWNRGTSYFSYSPFVIIGHQGVPLGNGRYNVRSKSIAFADYASSPSDGSMRINITQGDVSYLHGAPLIDTRYHRVIGIFGGNNIVTPLKDLWDTRLYGIEPKYFLGDVIATEGHYCMDQKEIYYSSPIYSSKKIIADDRVWISSIIYSGSTITGANEEVVLNSGFEVKQGATFEVNMHPCNIQ